MKVYCIIVTYNGMKWIGRCLGSVRASKQPVQVIVIDNASADGTAGYIRENFTEVLLIEAGVNLGFGQANNMGFKKALAENADYVFLLNQDAFIAPDCIDILIKTSKANKEYGILSPFHLSYSGNEIEEYFKKYIIALEASDYINDLYFENVKNIYAVSFVHAAGWLLPIDTVKKVGGFDPLFFHYGEDIDYINRVKFFGFNAGIVPSSLLYHKGTNSGLTIKKRNFNFEKNLILIKLKNVQARLRGQLLIFIKSSFDKITSAILYQRFNDFIFDTKLLFKTIFAINKIIKARKMCSKEAAYLQD